MKALVTNVSSTNAETESKTERILDADGFISASDVPLDSRAEVELIKQQLNEFKRALINQPIVSASPKKKQKIESTSANICDGDETIVRTDESSELNTLRRQLIEFSRMLNEQDNSGIETDILSRGKTPTERPGTIGRAKRVLNMTDQPFNRYE